MTDIAASANAARVATKAAKDATDAAHGALPMVVETAELAMEIPSKVILNQKLIVAVSILAGAALGAGLLYGVNKFRNRNKETPVVDEAASN